MGAQYNRMHEDLYLPRSRLNIYVGAGNISSPAFFGRLCETDQWSSVIGLDWQGWTDQFISLQWFQTSIRGSESDLVNNQREDVATFLRESNFLNETLTAEWVQIHSLDHGDGVAQAKLTYNYEANIDIYAGVDVFYGNRNDLFGQFDETDRATIGIVWGF